VSTSVISPRGPCPKLSRIRNGDSRGESSALEALAAVRASAPLSGQAITALETLAEPSAVSTEPSVVNPRRQPPQKRDCGCADDREQWHGPARNVHLTAADGNNRRGHLRRGGVRVAHDEEDAGDTQEEQD